VILGIIFMDLVMYFQHRMMHRYPFLWRVHRVHHTDKHIDISTGIRFHPLEEIIIMGMKVLGVAFFGVPALAVFIYEVLLSFAFLYTHLNVRLHLPTEKILRYVIVTPGMHRIHHSDFYKETNSNYGFCFSGWDRLFGSYRKKSLTGERKLLFGLEEYRDEKYQTLENLLLLPFNIKNLKIRARKIRATKFKSFEK
jgi:sterol desaturase/sphingolipid hydroxylase (fatty acid hydroxylase superfamily)